MYHVLNHDVPFCVTDSTFFDDFPRMSNPDSTHLTVSRMLFVSSSHSIMSLDERSKIDTGDWLYT